LAERIVTDLLRDRPSLHVDDEADAAEVVA
jgi:hypothetical protein